MLHPLTTTIETEKFIEKYLDNEESPYRIKNPFDIKERWNIINSDLIADNVNAEDIATYIRRYLAGKTNYHVFLRTKYWHIVADWVKLNKNNRCELCWSTLDLRAHHPDYSIIHGYEIQMVEYIKCLCNVCHTKHHDGIPPETKEEATNDKNIFKNALVTEKYIGYQLCVLKDLVNKENSHLKL